MVQFEAYLDNKLGQYYSIALNAKYCEQMLRVRLEKKNGAETKL